MTTESKRPTVLLKVDEALRSQARSGIHRVIVELARALPGHAATHLVCWDRLAGHLRPIDRYEFDLLFGVGNWPEGLTPNPAARRVNYRFDALVDCSGETWLLNPDVPMHDPEGVEILSRIISQCREYGVRTAAIFYDLIPATNPAYASHRAAYLSYLCEVGRSDLLLAISEYSADAFRSFWGERSRSAQECKIVAVPLAEESPHVRVVSPGSEADKSHIVLIGAVEPRKRQVEFLKAYSAGRQRSQALAALDVRIVGSLHPAVAREFDHLVRQTPGVRYLRFVPDAEIENLLKHAAFCAFVSDDEGFGLPIVESLAAGVPCLCADFGAMAEVAAGGGCFTVDVRDPVALEDGLCRLAEDLNLRARLRREISGRSVRTWNNYAGSVVAALGSARPIGDAHASVVVAIDDLDPFQETDIWRVARSDVVVASTSEARDRFIAAAVAADVDTLLPRYWVIAGSAEAEQRAAELASTLTEHRRRLDRIGRTERRYAEATKALRGETAPRSTFLRIVVSTFNRLPFVVENVGWLLEALKDHSDVELVVVDNVSTDGTAEALERTFGSRLRLIVNPANVGMLGNLRVCSQLHGAEYVWLVGDDDFIVPSQIRGIVAALKANLGVPLACVNFAVYHREALGPADSGKSLIAEQVPLAPNAIDSGVYPVKVVAAQHDNLFTAIYGIIWRHDVLAAAYDYPFSGRPFESLVESIPCTKVILESFAACDAYWHKPVAIVGNAHNSWKRHRPRWHGRLMAEAIALARDAGVDPVRLWPWARLQADLYEEASAIARGGQFPLQMDEEDAYELSWPLFRRRLSLRAAT